MRTTRLTLLFLTALAAAFAQQAQYDLLLQGGYVIDPRNGISGRRDVAVSDGLIAAVEESIDPSRAARTVDVSDLYITPGLIDLHVHVFSTTNIPDAWAGLTILEAQRKVKAEHDAIVIGVEAPAPAGASSPERAYERMAANPPADRVLRAGESLIVLASKQPRW